MKHGEKVQKHKDYPMNKGPSNKNRYGLFSEHSKKALGFYRDGIDDEAAETLSAIDAERAEASYEYYDDEFENDDVEADPAPVSSANTIGDVISHGIAKARAEAEARVDAEADAEVARINMSMS